MRIDRVRPAAVLTTCLLLVALALPATVLGHAELVATSPDAGSTVEGSPETVTATFSEALEAPKGSIEVRAADGTTVATGGLDADDPKTLSVDVPSLAPGTYRVRWTASSDDGHLERGRFDFTIAEAASPGPTPEPTATVAPSAAVPSTDVAPSHAPSEIPATAAPPSASPAPSATPEGATGGSESIGQILVVAVAGIAVGIGIGWWRSRRAA